MIYQAYLTVRNALRTKYHKRKEEEKKTKTNNRIAKQKNNT